MNRHHPFVPTRLASYLCALALVLAATLAPARVALADDVVSVGTWEELKTALGDAGNAGKTIQLTGDIHNASDDNWINITFNVTLDLNGYTLTLFGGTRLVTNTDQNQANTLTIKNTGSTGGIVGEERTQPLFEVNNSGTINLTNVDISGCSMGVVKVGSESTNLVVSGCNIHDNTNTNGGAIYAEGGTITIEAGTRIADNYATDKGGGIYAKDCTLTMTNGSSIENNVAGKRGGGIALDGAAKATISGGTISQNHSMGTTWWDGGGGIDCDGSTQLLLSGGKITGNISEAGGGGIRFWAKDVTLNGAEISNNIAKLHEGGGISVMNGRATFVSGRVLGNRTGYLDMTTPNPDYVDWGGGGIFVSDQGAVAVFPATTLVTDNSAGGFGGGLAACSTGRTYVLDTIGIYGNTADGEHISGGGSAKREDHTYAYDSEVFMSNGYQDYFSALYTYITNDMPGGYENWSGSADSEVVSPLGAQAGVIEAFSVCGLSANPTNEIQNAQLVITNNLSYTHGGGILNNGTIIYGDPKKASMTIKKALSINGDKKLVDLLNPGVELRDLLMNPDDSSRCFFEVTDSDGAVVATGRATVGVDEQGKPQTALVFDRRIILGTVGERKYYIRESQVTQSWMSLDSAIYELTVNVGKRVDKLQVPSGDGTSTVDVTQEVFYIISATVSKSTDGGATWEVVNNGTSTTAADNRGWDFENVARGAVISLRGIGDEVPAVFTNTASTTRSITITKVWDDEGDADGVRPTAEEFAGMLTLTADGEVVAGAKPTVTLADANTYTVTYADLPLYTVSEDAAGNKVGTEIVYAITETAPEGYTAAYTNDDTTVTDRVRDGGTITNSHTPVDRPVPGALPPTGDAGVPLGAVGGLAVLGSALICAVALRIRREQA